MPVPTVNATICRIARIMFDQATPNDNDRIKDVELSTSFQIFIEIVSLRFSVIFAAEQGCYLAKVILSTNVLFLWSRIVHFYYVV